MAGEQWKVGDEVQLKSGGPVMTVTVEKTMGLGNVSCTWFDNNKLASGVFPADALKRYEQG